MGCVAPKLPGGPIPPAIELDGAICLLPDILCGGPGGIIPGKAGFASPGGPCR